MFNNNNTYKPEKNTAESEYCEIHDDPNTTAGHEYAELTTRGKYDYENLSSEPRDNVK